VTADWPFLHGLLSSKHFPFAMHFKRDTFYSRLFLPSRFWGRHLPNQFFWNYLSKINIYKHSSDAYREKSKLADSKLSPGRSVKDTTINIISIIECGDRTHNLGSYSELQSMWFKKLKKKQTRSSQVVVFLVGTSVSQYFFFGPGPPLNLIYLSP